MSIIKARESNILDLKSLVNQFQNIILETITNQGQTRASIYCRKGLFKKYRIYPIRIFNTYCYSCHD